MPHTYAVDADTAFLTLTREERDILWEEAAADVAAAGDLELVLRDGPRPHDLEMRLRVARGLHMLDDLGWDRYEDPRSEYHLTVPAPWLAGYLRDCIDAQREGVLACQETAARGESCGHVLSDYEIRETECQARRHRRAAHVLEDLSERVAAAGFPVAGDRVPA